MCVRPRKHMLSCVAGLWRTQSTSFPQLSLVAVSELCGRTGSNRMDCCVIDFNLESAACCSPSSPPFPLHSRDPAGPQAVAYLQGISLIALLRKTHLRKVAGSRFKTGILQPEPIISHITSLSLGAIMWAFSANVSINSGVCFFFLCLLFFLTSPNSVLYLLGWTTA